MIFTVHGKRLLIGKGTNYLRVYQTQWIILLFKDCEEEVKGGCLIKFTKWGT